MAAIHQTPLSFALSQPASAERRAVPASTSARVRTTLLGLSTARSANALRAQRGAPIARAPRRALAARAALGWAGRGPARDPEQRQRELYRALNLGALAALGAAAAAQLLAADLSPWDAYSAAVATNPIETKACISGAVYALGDLVAQSYEGRDVASWDRGRALRSGAVGFLAHGPLSHLYYLALDQAFAAQTLLPAGSWAIPALKIGIDQTLWSLLWNSTYYALLGALRMEPPAVIARSVRESYWDLLRAGWRLWPLVHVLTYGVIPVQHRLLFVDGVELVWVSVLSVSSAASLVGQSKQKTYSKPTNQPTSHSLITDHYPK
jgi:hypothetical protein